MKHGIQESRKIIYFLNFLWWHKNILKHTKKYLNNDDSEFYFVL